MSLHRSLKTKPSALDQHRNVLTRAERIARLSQDERFDPESDSPFGLVKVGNRQIVTKKKEKAAKTDTEGEGEGEGEEAAKTEEAKS